MPKLLCLIAATGLLLGLVQRGRSFGPRIDGLLQAAGEQAPKTRSIKNLSTNSWGRLADALNAWLRHKSS